MSIWTLHSGGDVVLLAREPTAAQRLNLKRLKRAVRDSQRLNAFRLAAIGERCGLLPPQADGGERPESRTLEVERTGDTWRVLRMR